MQKLNLKIKVKQVEWEALAPQIVLHNPNLKIKVKWVEQVDLQKPNLKIRIKHVEERIDIQKPNLNIKVKEGSKTYIIDQTYNQRFEKYLDSTICSPKCWITNIQKNKGSTWLHKLFLFFLRTCTTTEDVDLVWEDFANLYSFTYFSIHLLEHA
jgi:hypothetical protein